MQNSFTVSLDLTRKEFVSAMFRCYLASRRARIYLLLLFILISLSEILGWVTTSKGPTLVSVITLIVPLVVILSLYAGFLLFACFYFYRTKPYLFKNVTLEFTHWGMVRSGEMVSFSKPWREIAKFKETRDFFFLYTGGIDVQFVQKRMFRDLFETEQFKDMLKENINR
jgi:hypothetical protein